MPIGKYKAKEWIKLKEISGDEAKILNSMYNVPFGAYGISHSYSRHKKYYLCECKNNLRALNYLALDTLFLTMDLKNFYKLGESERFKMRAVNYINKRNRGQGFSGCPLH